MYTELAEMAENNFQGPANRFGGTPQQLVTDGEGGKILRAQVHLADSANGYRQSPGGLDRCQFPAGDITIIGDDLDPLVVTGNNLFDFGERQILLELDGEGL